MKNQHVQTQKERGRTIQIKRTLWFRIQRTKYVKGEATECIEPNPSLGEGVGEIS